MARNKWSVKVDRVWTAGVDGARRRYAVDCTRHRRDGAGEGKRKRGPGVPRCARLQGQKALTVINGSDEPREDVRTDDSVEFGARRDAKTFVQWHYHERLVAQLRPGDAHRCDACKRHLLGGRADAGDLNGAGRRCRDRISDSRIDDVPATRVEQEAIRSDPVERYVEVDTVVDEVERNARFGSVCNTEVVDRRLWLADVLCKAVRIAPESIEGFRGRIV